MSTLYKPYTKAREAGYSDDEIFEYFLTESQHKDKIQQAVDEGFTQEDIIGFISEKPERSTAEEIGRGAAQVGLGLLEASPAGMAYEAAVAPLASESAQLVSYRQNIGDDIERLLEQKEMGIWDDQDQALYDDLVAQLKDPSKSEPFVKTADVSIQNLAEKATGLDLTPDGVLEKGARWYGYLKSGKPAKELINFGGSPKAVIKNVFDKDIVRSLGAGTALQMAENNELGPLGTLGAAIIGDLAGGGVAALGKAALQPKNTLANLAAKTASSKAAIKNDLKAVAEEAKFTKDIGSLTDNNVVQMIQSRLAASGLTGKPLENLRKQITREVVDEYKAIGDLLGEAKYQSIHEAGGALQNHLTDLRDMERNIYRNFYKKARGSFTPGETVNVNKLYNKFSKRLSELEPGAVKGTDKKRVLEEFKNFLGDVKLEEGQYVAPIDAMLNNAVEFGQIANWDVQKGVKQLFKEAQQEIKDVLKTNKDNVKFAKEYIAADKNAVAYENRFNKTIQKLINNKDPEKVMKIMDSVQGVKDLQKALSITPEGKQLFGDLKRLKLDRMLGDNLQNSVNEQLKSGKFLSAMEKPKNRELLQSIMPKEAYQRLTKLQKHVGRLQEASTKFLNASQSATAHNDLQTIGGLLGGIYGLMTGNPWIITGLGTLGGARYLSNLIADPQFLKMTEEAIKTSASNKVPAMNKIAQSMVSYIKEVAPAVLETEKSTLER